MEQKKTGQYIMQKRKEKNMTQEELAEKLSVSNKTVSKWETGKSMPDYSVVEELCKVLGISVGELLNGEDELSTETEEKQMLALLEKWQVVEKHKHILYGIILVLIGVILHLLSSVTGGSAVQDFISGALLGISTGVMIIGVVVAVAGILKKD